MSKTIIYTALPSMLATVTAASGIGLAPFTVDLAAKAMLANDRRGDAGTTNVVDYRTNRKAG